MGGQGDEGLQVVANDFGGDILDLGLLGQSGDVFQIEPVLESFERLVEVLSHWRASAVRSGILRCSSLGRIDMINCKGMCFPTDVILVCIRWYVAFPLSYR